MEVLDEPTWRVRAAAHEARLAPYVAPHLARRRTGERHPVHDFLFAYYSQRPAQLLRWHPGYGIGLADADAYVGLRGYEVSRLAALAPQPPGTLAPQPPGTLAPQPPGTLAPQPPGTLAPQPPGTLAPQPPGTLAPRPPGTLAPRPPVVTVGDAHVVGQRELLEATRRLLVATAGRAVHTGCFGLHEWAMVYRSVETRHPQPLRLGRAGTDAVVESHRIACSHFDAFRFFTDDARPRNTLRPGREDRERFEQPGCLHAGMDLYKHAFRLTPMVCSDLVADCFELAWDIRELDMRAAPYDLRGFGYEPVRIETPEGKREYAAAQRDFADRAAPLRARLAAECERLLAVTVAA